MSATLHLDVCPLFVVNVRHFTFRCLSPPLWQMSDTYYIQMSVPPLSFKMSVTFDLQMSVPLLSFIGDNPSARRRRNHCTVEEGVYVVPTLRNRVVIFWLRLIIQVNLDFSRFIKTNLDFSKFIQTNLDCSRFILSDLDV